MIYVICMDHKITIQSLIGGSSLNRIISPQNSQKIMKSIFWASGILTIIFNVDDNRICPN